MKLVLARPPQRLAKRLRGMGIHRLIPIEDASDIAQDESKPSEAAGTPSQHAAYRHTALAVRWTARADGRGGRIGSRRYATTARTLSGCHL